MPASLQVMQPREICAAEDARFAWYAPQNAVPLFQEVERYARQVRDHADLLRMHDSIDKQSHAFYLARMKERVNAMSNAVCRLQAVRNELADWQQKSLDRIAPWLIVTANQLEKAIAEIDDFRPAYLRGDYRTRLDLIYDRTSRISQSVDDVVDYAKLRRKMDAVSKRLDVGESTTS